MDITCCMVLKVSTSWHWHNVDNLGATARELIYHRCSVKSQGKKRYTFKDERMFTYSASSSQYSVILYIKCRILLRVRKVKVKKNIMACFLLLARYSLIAMGRIIAYKC